MSNPLVHFIGVEPAQYWSAMRVWGRPDYIHPRATWSCLGEIDRHDIVIFGAKAFTLPKKWRGKLLTAHDVQQEGYSNE